MLLEWYTFLSKFYASVADPITKISDALNIPVLSALLMGVLGTTAPCQLTTNATAIAYVSRQLSNPFQAARTALAYLLGKVLVYSLMGGLVVFLGTQAQALSIPVIIVVKKALGPLMILVGLYMLGVLKLRISLGQGFSRWLKGQAQQHGIWGAFLLGVAFSFAFCPTLFLLFFSVVIPLSLSATGGWVFPAIFALGTTLPLLVFTSIFLFGSEMAASYVKKMKNLDKYLRRIAGIIFLLAGLNDTFLYWMI
jgi:cytochrome c biogenesis protein CcdA